MENKTICTYPWHSAAIKTDGRLVPCCLYTDRVGNKDHFVWSSDARDSDHWREIRKLMLAGEPVKGCTQCYDNEKFGKKSLRSWSIQQLPLPTDNKVYPLEFLEIVFSNLCNLACVSCMSGCSTKWASEDVKAGRISKQHIQIESTFDFNNWDLSKLNRLKIIGGEPMMEQKRFIEVMKQVNLSKIHLSVNTNGTSLPNNELKSLIESAKSVWFSVSIDSINSINDWYRWPSKFNEILKTLDTYTKWWRDKKQINLVIHCVVSSLTILELQDFVDFFEKNYPEWMLDFDWIVFPSWQTVESLPQSVKDKLIQEFKTARPLTHSINKMNPYEYSISKLQESPKVTWATMKENIIAISKERNLDFFEMVPKFKDIWDVKE